MIKNPDDRLIAFGRACNMIREFARDNNVTVVGTLMLNIPSGPGQIPVNHIEMIQQIGPGWQVGNNK